MSNNKHRPGVGVTRLGNEAAHKLYEELGTILATNPTEVAVTATGLHVVLSAEFYASFRGVKQEDDA